jgi:Ca2+-binding EF-hand superfamily protein
MHRSVRRRLMTTSRPSFMPSACLAVAVTLGVIGTAAAQQDENELTPGFYERLAFDAADTDGDGLVSEAELARDAAAGFSGLDVDRSGTLTPEELGPHDPAMFARVDADGDGVLTFSEVMLHKTQGFADADANQDGKLSFEEMVDGVEAELGAAS